MEAVGKLPEGNFTPQEMSLNIEAINKVTVKEMCIRDRIKTVQKGEKYEKNTINFKNDDRLQCAGFKKNKSCFKSLWNDRVYSLW